MIKNKKILIAVSDNFIGADLVNQLLKNNNQIIAADVKKLKYWLRLYDEYKNHLSWRLTYIC